MKEKRSNVESDNKNVCFLCSTEHDNSELTKVSEGYICSQCIHYRNVSKAIVIPSAILVYFIVHAFAYLLLYNTPLSFILLPSPIIWFFIIKFSINPIARNLSIKKYWKTGFIKPGRKPEKNTPLSKPKRIQSTVSNEEEMRIIDLYRTASDDAREEVLLCLDLEPVPEKKKKTYKKYSSQENKILQSYCSSSKAVQNKVRDILNY